MSEVLGITSGLAALGAALAVIGAGIGIGVIGKAATEASNKIQTAMIIIAALLEGVALFAIIVCMLVATK